MLLLRALLLLLPGAQAAWWHRPWREEWLNISLEGHDYRILARRVGEGTRKVFCVQGGPGDTFWDLNFLAVYLDLNEFEVIQYNPLGAWPSDCSHPSEDCYHSASWMNVASFVSTMDQVYRALRLPSDTIVVAHSFGVVVTLEFTIRWPERVVGLTLSDWVPSQGQSEKRHKWCVANDWQGCRLGMVRDQPWLDRKSHNHTKLTRTIWGPRGDGSGGALEGWDVRDRLSSLRHIPTLSLVGEYDIVNVDDVKEMSKALGGDFRLLRGAGHQCFVDRRRAWLQSWHAWQRRVPQLSAGCRAPRGLQGGAAETGPLAQWIGGRRYYLSLPANYRPERPHSLVLSFHGLMSTAQRAPLFGPVPPAWGDTILAFPVGKEDAVLGGAFATTWNGSGSVGSPGPAGATCNQQKVRADAVITECASSCVSQGGCRDACWLTTCADDVGFVAELLQGLGGRHCVNERSVHAMGFSGGGWFVMELGTNPRVANRFKTILSFAGLPFRGFNRAPSMKHGSRFVGVYGRADVYVPGFPNSRTDPSEAISKHGFAFSTWSNTTMKWASTWGCGLTLQPSTIRPGGDGSMECFDYDCPQGVVSVCLWPGPHEIAPTALALATQAFFPNITGPAEPGPAPRAVQPGHALVAMAAVAALALAAASKGRKEGLARPLLAAEEV